MYVDKTTAAVTFPASLIEVVLSGMARKPDETAAFVMHDAVRMDVRVNMAFRHVCRPSPSATQE